MKLRKLELKDAPLMLEWMHDPDVVRDLQTRFSEKTLQDCESFIRAAADMREDCHFAVADDHRPEAQALVDLALVGIEQVLFFRGEHAVEVPVVIDDEQVQVAVDAVGEERALAHREGAFPIGVIISR